MVTVAILSWVTIVIEMIVIEIIFVIETYRQLTVDFDGVSRVLW
jgi:hypothetical protein